MGQLLERGSVSPPIYMTSTFAFPNVAAADAVVADEVEGFLYGRAVPGGYEPTFAAPAGRPN